MKKFFSRLGWARWKAVAFPLGIMSYQRDSASQP